jgi:hypothetical protein
MKIVHRDFPFPRHQYAKLAARYANAAGELGFYDVVVGQLFRTQPIWSKSGAIDQQVGQVLPGGVMTRLRKILENDPKLDETVAADFVRARSDDINQTPSLVFVYNGKRENVTQSGSFAILQNYLDQLPVLRTREVR